MINKNTLENLLAVQAKMLLDKDRHTADAKNDGQADNSQHEAGEDVAEDKHDDSHTDGDGCPRDVAAF